MVNGTGVGVRVSCMYWRGGTDSDASRCLKFKDAMYTALTLQAIEMVAPSQMWTLQTCEAPNVEPYRIQIIKARLERPFECLRLSCRAQLYSAGRAVPK